MKRRKWLLLPLIPLLLAAVYLLAPLLVPAERFGFAYEVPKQEAALRLALVGTAQSWLGVQEDDGSHRPIINRYNTLSPLPQDYRVTYDDAWCAVFGTVAAMEANLTDIIPPECSCSRQIKLFQKLERWMENDSYRPLPGDYIYYDWDFGFFRDCTGWPEHTGIVVGTYGPFIRVIEGNKDNDVSFRTIWQNDWCIRGYGLPDYASKCD